MEVSNALSNSELRGRQLEHVIQLQDTEEVLAFDQKNASENWELGRCVLERLSERVVV